MKLLALASLLSVPTVWAASTPQCKSFAKSAYLYSLGPAKVLTFFNVSETSAGDNAFYLQDDMKTENEYHEAFDVVHCQVNSSIFDPGTYMQVHLSRNSSQCLGLGGPGPDMDDVKPASESFTEANTLRMMPCEDPSSPKFRLQTFASDLNMFIPYELPTMGSDKEASRKYVGFRNNKIYVMAEAVEGNDAEETTTLNINVWPK